MRQVFKNMINIQLKFYENVYLVGGAVRDFLLKRKIKDIDFVCICNEREFESFALEFFKKNFKVKPFLFGKKHPLTYRAVKSGITIDLTILEKDFDYDAKRRDFTINSIYYDFKSKNFIDPLNGIEDIKKKIIKNSSEYSFQNDPLRILRAFRFFAVLDDFKIEKTTIVNCKKYKRLLKKVAAERIREEIEKIILSDKSYIVFKNLKNLEILEELFNNIKWNNIILLKKIPKNLNEFEKKIFSYALLFPDEIKKLKLSNKEIKIINEINYKYKELLMLEDENEIKRFIFQNREYIQFIFKFCSLFFTFGKKEIVDKYLKKFISNKKDIFSFINGDDIIQLGFSEGKEIGKILEEVRFLYFKGDISSKNEAISYIKKNFLN